MNLYDYLYVDLEKVISLYSQLTGGVVELRETQTEKGSTSDNKRNYDFKVFKHDAGGTAQGQYRGRIKLINIFIKKANKGKYRRALYKFK